ncbi:MAG: hypothetical protein JSU86_20685, partial [Phycisphaerales bacterium]
RVGLSPAVNKSLLVWIDAESSKLSAATQLCIDWHSQVFTSVTSIVPQPGRFQVGGCAAVAPYAILSASARRRSGSTKKRRILPRKVCFWREGG